LAGQWEAELEQALAGGEGQAIGLGGMRDVRVARAVAAVNLLQNGEATRLNAGQVRGVCAEAVGADPNTVIRLAERLGVEIHWQRLSASGVYDVVFRPRWVSQPAQCEVPAGHYKQYVNAPARNVGDAGLGRKLQEHLRESLPDYMVPS